jgi:hypothetical protein
VKIATKHPAGLCYVNNVECSMAIVYRLFYSN